MYHILKEKHETTCSIEIFQIWKLLIFSDVGLYVHVFRSCFPFSVMNVILHGVP